MPGLGRYAAPDPRDGNYPLRAITPASKRGWRYWHANGYWGDQGQTPQCVGYGWVHWLEDGPVTHRHVPPPVILPTYVYNEAQKIDEWPGTDYDGTSVRAGAKILQREGFIAEYRWAFDLETVVDAILEKGPVGFGTNWYSDMYMPDSKGFVTPTGSYVGGHFWIANGVNRGREWIRCKNSWGRDWGPRGGHFWMTFEAARFLLEQNGDACMAVEIAQ